MGAGLCALVSAVGIALSVVLTLWKFRADYTCDASPLSACEVGPGFSCAVALASDWATLLGLPLTLHAAAFYSVTLALAVRLLLRPGGGAAARMLGVLSIWGAVVSAVMATIATVALHTICLYCALLYLLSALLLGGALVVWVLGPAARRREVLLVSVWTCVGFTAVLALPGLIYHRAASEQLADGERCGVTSPGALPATNLRYPADADGRAPVVIAMFVDPACPSCRQEFTSLRALVDERNRRQGAGQGAIELQIFYFPRERGVCGPRGFDVAAAASMANHACDAARAVACVESLWPGHGVDMLTRVFALQDSGGPGEPFFTRSKLAAAARDIGVPLDPTDPREAFHACVRGEWDVSARVDAHMAFGQAIGISATPHSIVVPRAPDGALEWRRARTYVGAKPRAFVERLLDDLQGGSSR